MSLDIALKLSVCISVLILRVSDIFMKFSMYNVYFSPVFLFRIFLGQTGVFKKFLLFSEMCM